MNPEFYLILDSDELTEELADTVYEAGFDDSSLTMRGGKAAIWICHRPGELTQIVREALEQARRSGLHVSHVEIVKCSLRIKKPPAAAGGCYLTSDLSPPTSV